MQTSRIYLFVFHVNMETDTLMSFFFALVFAYFRGVVSVLVCVDFDWNIMETVHFGKCDQFLYVHWE